MKWYPGIPAYLDQAWVAQAVAALQCPETKAVLSSVRAPMSRASIRVQLREFVSIHRLPDRPRSALRARQVRAPGARRTARSSPRLTVLVRVPKKSQSRSGAHGSRTLTAKSQSTRSPAGDHAQAHAETAVLRAAFGPKSAVNYRHSDALDESARAKL